MRELLNKRRDDARKPAHSSSHREESSRHHRRHNERRERRDNNGRDKEANGQNQVFTPTVNQFPDATVPTWISTNEQHRKYTEAQAAYLAALKAIGAPLQGQMGPPPDRQRKERRRCEDDREESDFNAALEAAGYPRGREQRGHREQEDRRECQREAPYIQHQTGGTTHPNYQVTYPYQDSTGVIQGNSYNQRQEEVFQEAWEICRETPCIDAIANYPNPINFQVPEFRLYDGLDREDDIPVLPIVGMGGLGKTTLAQLVYNDDRVKGNFEYRMWVCVTDNYDYRRVVKEMIEYRSEMKYDITTLSNSQLVTRLLDLISGKKFFLVLDDVWIESHNTWKDLKDLLRQGAKGSIVMITTRSTKVSEVSCSGEPYSLDFLPEEKCWPLFERNAFRQHDNIDEGVRAELEIIGREIVNNCKRLPLAIKALGSALHGITNVKKWQRILKHKFWKAEEQSGSSSKPMILPALKLSYDLLPSYLKQCFSYCHLFPKSHVFYKNEMVKLWKAQSFIQPDSDGQDSLDEIGIDYFDVLSSKSFFQTIDNHKRYKMHDFHHDLAEYVSRPHCYQIKDHESYRHISENSRHVSLVCNNVEEAALKLADKAKKLRSLIMPNIQYQHVFGHDTLDTLFRAFKCLRTLDLSSSSLIELPDSVEELKLLHQLDLSRTGIRQLPESICNLINLHTLKLLQCVWLLELPKDLCKLANLENLELDEIFWFKLSNLPPRLGNLNNLQNLHAFRISRESGYRINELNKMKFLVGELHISQLENAVNAVEAELNMKENLDKLVLEWSQVNGPNSLDDRQTRDEIVLENLKPHTNLKELCIIGYTGTWIPSWISQGFLRNLVKLFLKRCSQCKDLSIGNLEHLSELHIKGMLELEEWREDPEFFYPSLDTLKITNCPKLTKLPLFFPNVRVLQVKRCDALKTLPVSINLTFLELADNLILDDWNEINIESYDTVNDGYIDILSCINIIEMKIVNCPQLRTFPVYFAPQKLLAERCPLLNTLPITEMSQRLQCLALDVYGDGQILSTIRETGSLYSLAVSNTSGGLIRQPQLPRLSGLKALYIHNCTTLVCAFPEEQALPTLKTLSILKCLQLTKVAEHRLPNTLECLSIGSCPSLKSLGPNNMLNILTSLVDLYIFDCPAIESLPEEGLPTSLNHLQIQGCSLLSKQCREENGLDWSKVKNVPDLQIEPFIEGPSSSSSSPSPPWFRRFVCCKGIIDTQEPQQP